MQEMQRSLFLLTGMARLLGQWQLALPGSLPAARQLAATFLELAAQARLGERLAFHCTPVDPKEKASTHHEPVSHAERPQTLPMPSHTARAHHMHIESIGWSTILTACVHIR